MTITTNNHLMVQMIQLCDKKGRITSNGYNLRSIRRMHWHDELPLVPSNCWIRWFNWAIRSVEALCYFNDEWWRKRWWSGDGVDYLTWIGVNPGCVPTATHTPRNDALAKSCSALRVMASNGNKNNQSKCDHGNNERRQSRTIRD